MSSIAVSTASPSATFPCRSRSRMLRRASPIASAMPFRYGAASTPSSSGVGSAAAPVTTASVILASAYSFWASWRYPAYRICGWSSTAARPSSIAAFASSISRCATSSSPRWIARIAFAQERIAAREAGSARSRASMTSSNRRRSPSEMSSRFTTRRLHAGDADVAAGRPDHDGRAVFGAEGGEAVEGGARRAPRCVGCVPETSAPRTCRRGGVSCRRVAHLRFPPQRDQEPDVDAEEGYQRGPGVPHHPKGRHEADQEREADALEHEDEDAAAALPGPGLRARLGPDERDPLPRRDDPPPVCVPLGSGEQIHPPFEVPHAPVRRPPPRREEEGGPYHGQGREKKPTHAPAPSCSDPRSATTCWAGTAS